VSQLERKFKKTFLVTPSDYLLKVRINKACDYLGKTTDTIASIALNCGFYDHSDFTRKFVRAMGLTPKHYRESLMQPQLS
jgi:transcriptional regulator GlxA family with amidase domain